MSQRNNRANHWAATAAVLLLCAWPAPAQKTVPVEARPAKAGNPAVSSAGFAPEQGKFRILLDGQQVGSEEFELSASEQTWLARSSTVLRAPGGDDVKASGQLRVAADAAPVRYEWSAQAQKKASGAVDFAGGTAKTAINLTGNSPFRQDFLFNTSRVIVLDNNLYYQYAMLARLYDWKKGGKQDFPVLIPQDMTPGSISAESLGARQTDGGSFETMRVSSPDVEILLYLNASRQLMRLEVPAAKVTIQRE